MTREEAKDYIREWCPYDRQEDILKALEQEPCDKCVYSTSEGCQYDDITETIPPFETSDDAISRDKAIVQLSHNKTGDDDCDVIIQKDIETIKALPPVTPQPKMGHWIKFGVPRCGEQHYKCTSCGYYINFGQWGELYTKEFKYCPNCKAKMVEPQARSEE